MHNLLFVLKTEGSATFPSKVTYLVEKRREGDFVYLAAKRYFRGDATVTIRIHISQNVCGPEGYNNEFNDIFINSHEQLTVFT